MLAPQPDAFVGSAKSDPAANCCRQKLMLMLILQQTQNRDAE
jgi:hypothetical protein